MNIDQLHQRFLECDSVSTDTRKITKNTMFFALKGAHFDGNTFTDQAIKNGAKYVIIDNPSFEQKPHTILVENVLKTLQQLATFHRDYLSIPIIALTGSNGKTTTKELINATLSKRYNVTATRGNLNNHIGVPLTLLSMNKDTQIGIVEMGANHIKEIAFLCAIAKPDFGYITNFGKAHLEGFGSVEGVIIGKTELYKYLINHNKKLFVNSSDKLQIQHSENADTFIFGPKNSDNSVSIGFIEANPFVKVLYKTIEIESQLIGDYNFNNISAAIAIANYFEVTDSDIKNAIKNYCPQNNRSQIITVGSTQIILDAYNANPTSMKAALENFSKQNHKNKIAILGDMFELGKDAEMEHQEIVSLLSNLDIKQSILIGENFYLVKSNQKHASFYKSFTEFKNEIKSFNFKESLILIKGSRGMALERVLDLMD